MLAGPLLSAALLSTLPVGGALTCARCITLNLADALALYKDPVVREGKAKEREKAERHRQEHVGKVPTSNENQFMAHLNGDKRAP